MELLTTEAQSDQAITRPRGRYLYAIIDGGRTDLERFGLAGMDNGEVYGIENDGIVAVVSDTVDKKIRPERRRLAAHHNVLRRLMDDHTVLPMVFGVIADSPESIRRILQLNREAF